MAYMSLAETLSGPEDLVVTSPRDPITINPTTQMSSLTVADKKTGQSY